MRPPELLSRLDTFVSELDHDEAHRTLSADTVTLAAKLGEAVDRWAEATEAEEDAGLEGCSVCRRLAAAAWNSLLPKAADPITGRRAHGGRERRWCRCPECGTGYDYRYEPAPGAEAETLVRASDLGTAVAVQLRHLVKTGSSGLAAALLGNLRALRALLAGPPAGVGAATRAGRKSRSHTVRQA